MRSAPGGGRSPARRALGPAGEQSPPAPRTAGTAPKAASTMIQTPLVACRPPPGTNVSPPRATLLPQMPHPRSFVPSPRGEVVSKVWDYIKKHDLQNPENRREILADDTLEAVFGKKKVTMFEMNKYLAQHLTPPEAG